MFYEGEQPAFLSAHAAQLAEAFARDGVLVFRRLLAGDARFLAFCNDVRRLLQMLAGRVDLRFGDDVPLDEIVTSLAARDRAALGTIYDLGTQPNKLLSGNLLKTHPAFVDFAKACFGDAALLATPALSDTLHVFPPGEENFRYNLPIHQDYPYLLQSPRQFTIWINLGSLHEGVGGITVWPGSHEREVRMTAVSQHGHLETVVARNELTKYASCDITSDIGDVVIMDTHLLHSSNRNRTSDASRIVQLFRYSDLSDQRAISFGWASAERRVEPKVAFADLYPEKVQRDEAVPAAVRGPG